MKDNDWEILFDMQHYGVPTRLLDWTENFGIALFFAANKHINGGPEVDAAIYLLNPRELNGLSHIDRIYKIPYDEKFFSYAEIFWEGKSVKPIRPVAIEPIFNNDRIHAQRGVFTVHHGGRDPIEKNSPTAIKKVILKKEAINAAKEFLYLANIDDFSVFPDLTGVANYLRNKIELAYDKEYSSPKMQSIDWKEVEHGVQWLTDAIVHQFSADLILSISPGGNIVNGLIKQPKRMIPTIYAGIASIHTEISTDMVTVEDSDCIISIPSEIFNNKKRKIAIVDDTVMTGELMEKIEKLFKAREMENFQSFALFVSLDAIKVGRAPASHYKILEKSECVLPWGSGYGPGYRPKKDS